ncbi:DUF58 domain-containing protein [Verrucomicrobiaceae bacterium N1E253]|uniref:DUF58 domain-containing protein n=1 Tax=Oceaniferula marina TaxID=2748318 RepID=A0A851GEQ9_9BACT|nr:DUF58 domain-containing protein [Oceaniferula marina]NWK54211.1 DUF58 domain-containing protein [Oceaniferula marina]
MLNQKELESKVRHIQIYSRKAVLEMLAGEYRSSFKGMGIEFEDVRGYQHGDDVRSIDWNVTARIGRPHVKTFMEERELTLYFLVDVSASGEFGSSEMSKKEVMARIVALLAFASVHNHDNVGLILFAGDVEFHLPPRKGKNQVMRMVDHLMRHPTKSKGTNVKAALEYFQQVRRRRCVAFLFSDFLDTGYERTLGDVAHAHDLICVSIRDPRESELPSAGMLEFRDAESGELRTIDCKDGGLRARLTEQSERHQRQLKDLCHEVNAELLDISTDDDYLYEIIQFFRERYTRSADV